MHSFSRYLATKCVEMRYKWVHFGKKLSRYAQNGYIFEEKKTKSKRVILATFFKIGRFYWVATQKDGRDE